MSIEAEPLEIVRRLGLALPGTTERLSHGDAYRMVAPKRLLADLDARADAS